MREYRIVVDGPDGAGKTTLLKRVKEVAQQKWRHIDFLVVTDPNHCLRDEARKASVRDILLHPEVYSVDPSKPAPLSQNARLARNIEIPLIVAGEMTTLWSLSRTPKQNHTRVVLFDRWSTSTIVYQTFDDQLDRISPAHLRQAMLTYATAAQFEPDMDQLVLLTFAPEDEQKMKTRMHRGSDVYESDDEKRLVLDAIRRNRRFRYHLPSILSTPVTAEADSYRRMVSGVRPIENIEAGDPIEDNVKRMIEIIESVSGQIRGYNE